MTSRGAESGLARGILRRRTWRRAAYLLATLPVGVFWFTAVVILLAAGISLAVVWIGLPILWAAFQTSRKGAKVERRFLAWGLDLSIPEPNRPEPGGTVRERWLSLLGDPPTWRDIAYLILLLPLGILWFTLVLITLAVPLGLLVTPISYRYFPDGQFSFVSEGWEWVTIDSLPKALVVAGLGLILLLAVPAIVRGVAGLHKAIAAGLLGPSQSAALAAQVRELRTSREQGLDAAEFERQRIERNLHDGAQPRLVALAMELGMAKEKLDTDPEGAAELMDRAHQHAKQAIVELRDLARGIHPVILTDRGLDAALSALTGQSPVPVNVVNTLAERLQPPIESTAYFVIAEALANATKHSNASRIGVTVRRSDDLLTVEVCDNGEGGADPHGSGLRGLADRVGAVGGRLFVESKPGGPTVIRAEMPCES